jgi:hypothetical protein
MVLYAEGFGLTRLAVSLFVKEDSCLRWNTDERSPINCVAALRSSLRSE